MAPMHEKEVVIVVPKGTAEHVKVVEEAGAPSEITVKVSKSRKSTHLPVLGVMVK